MALGFTLTKVGNKLIVEYFTNKQGKCRVSGIGKALTVAVIWLVQLGGNGSVGREKGAWQMDPQCCS